MSTKELPWDRIATADKEGNRIYLYPVESLGKWNRRRSWLSIGLITIFLALPWVKIAGQQAILLDISNRKFAIFGLTFWAHDAPLLVFILFGSVILIAFITAIWGRVWCGWACPQTVFVEQVFRRAERWIEGDALARRKLDASPMSFEKFRKKTLKWGVFTVFALVLSHSFLAYFVGTAELARMMESSPFQNPAAFIVMFVVTAGILFDLGWFREQFCTLVCPYGRFQSVLMDSQSAVIAYDKKRGEPRRGTLSENGLQGDCVNCYRCVQVCPTGIDIRRGVQLECIACTACVDACDDVMGRLKKPLGLIRYGNQGVADGTNEVWTPWYTRVRAWVYLMLLLVCVAGLAVNAVKRAPIEITLIRAIDFPYKEIPSSTGQGEGILVLNHFKLEVRNQTFDSQEVTFSVSSELRDRGVTLVVSNHKSLLTPGEPERADLFIQFPKSLLQNGKGVIPIQVIGKSSQSPQPILIVQEAYLVGPLR